SGGRVVKNVAGYDMNKLYTGSFGSLAVITEVTLKLRPVPERAVTLAMTSRDLAQLFALGSRILSSELRPSSVVLTNHGLSNILDAGCNSSTLFIRFMESEAAVEYQIEGLRRLAASLGIPEVRALEASLAGGVWSKIADFDQSAYTVLRASVPLSSVRAAFQACTVERSGSIASADLGAGIIRIGLGREQQDVGVLTKSLRETVAGVGGTLFVERASAEIRREVDAWGDPGPGASIMTDIKRRFDPTSILNPGRFVRGI
ncbi:MAG TPA: hypothetical protein VJX67_03390, partial [Blastocatellia bacterium]|nr:hypothetical protein [Blastocatellia bacterium]